MSDREEASRPSSLGALAWCFYDWANSAFPTVIITFVFAAYFTSAVAPSSEIGTAHWGWALSLSAALVALLAPVMGAIADAGGSRKPWIAAFTGLAIVGSALLWLIEPDPDFVLLALVLVVLANLGFEIAQVFYNAMLPEVAGQGRLGRLSGWAWGLGYAGGLSCLAICLVIFVQPDPPLFGLSGDTAEQVRIVGPFVGLWFAVFALPLFLWVPESRRRSPLQAAIIARGLKTLGQTLRSLPKRKAIGRFLLARMIYTDGLNTLFAFGGIYAAGSFGMDIEEILLFGILLNVTAGLGAAAFAWIDDCIGPKPTLVTNLVALLLCSSLILLVQDKLLFYLLGSAIGIFVGPTQAASRSLMARLAPPAQRSELFGLYALSGKATAFLGPALVGWITLAADSQRVGMASILGFFLIGLLVLLPLKVPSENLSPR